MLPSIDGSIIFAMAVLEMHSCDMREDMEVFRTRFEMLASNLSLILS